MEKQILCLWFPNWPIQRVIAAQPELRKTHLVLFRRDSRRGQRVSAASPLAMLSGVEIDMPVSEVKQLLRHHGKKQQTWQPSHRAHPRTQHRQLAQHGIDPIPRDNDRTSEAPASASCDFENRFFILEHDPVADQRALEQLADSLNIFSPIVGIEQIQPPESCFLDVTGLEKLFGSVASLRSRAIEFLQQQGYTLLSAVADTPGMAWGLSHYHRTSRGEEVSPQQLRREFRKLPVAALRLMPDTLDTLQRLGIERIEQLIAIPRTHLTSRFGDEQNQRLDQAYGKIEEPIVARHRPAEFSANQFIEFPTRDRETISVILSRLIENVCKQLADRQKGALQWGICLDCVDAPAIEFEVNLFQPTATVTHVMQLMELQLESVLKPHLRRKRKKKSKTKSKTELGSPMRTVTRILIQEITVKVTSCVLLVDRQRELFDESPRLDKQALAHLINHLTSRLGQESIVYPTMQSGAVPEFSFRYKPLVDPKRMRSRKRNATQERSHTQARPLRLLDPPVLISEQATPLPFPFRHQDKWHMVTQQWGPERIETGWWQGPTHRRDYWRVETDTGQHFWLYFDLSNQQWFLQGEF